METFVATRRGQGESWRNGNSRGRRGNENPVFNCNQEETQPGVITRGTRPFGDSLARYQNTRSKSGYCEDRVEQIAPENRVTCIKSGISLDAFYGEGKIGREAFRLSSA